MPTVKILKKPAAKPAAPPPAPAQEAIPDGDEQQVVQPQATITKDHPDGTKTHTTEDVGGPIIMKPPMANVGVSMGMVIQTEPFNNIKFSVSLNIPCAVDVDEINETYAQIKGWVDDRVGEITDEIQSQLDGGEVVGQEDGAQ
jgi:hypothetical protein